VPTDDTLTDHRQAWAVMRVTFVAGIVAAINAFKVPPLMQLLRTELQVDMVTGGWLMSISSLSGLFLAIPTAFLLTRLGPRAIGSVALACTFSGATIGALAPNATALLLGRAVEGMSTSLIAITGPTVISMWFRPRERGLPMGLWAAWVPIGNVLIFNLAHPLQAAVGWRGVWGIGALLSLAALLLFRRVVTAPPRPAGHRPVPARSFGQVVAHPPSWLLALAFGTFSFALMGYNTWAPTFLAETTGVGTAQASGYASLMFLAAIPANIAAGWLLGRLKNRHALLPAAFALTALLLFWSFRLQSTQAAIPYMITLGFASNFAPTAVFAFAPETMPSLELAGLGQALVTMGSNVGSLTGPPSLGALFSRAGWAAGGTYLALIVGAGTLLAWFVARRLQAQ
jgi:predicted MFS family arabinose efflux permease